MWTCLKQFNGLHSPGISEKSDSINVFRFYEYKI